MTSVYVQVGYYKTLILEVSNKGRELTVLQKGYINSGNNFLIGRLNRVDEFAEHLSVKLKSDFKKSMDNVVLILPNDFVIESVMDANTLDVKNKPKEIKSISHKNRHIGLSGINIMHIGKNIYNDMYLTTEFDGKRMTQLLQALNKKGVHVKQALSPLNCMHHLARNVVCPFEVVNQNNNSNVVKTGILMVNVGINRLNYCLVHNNLPIEIREGSSNFMKLIDVMAHHNIPFVKIVRLLNLVGVEGLKDEQSHQYDMGGEIGGDLVLESLDDLIEPDTSIKLEKEADDNAVIFISEDESAKNKKKINVKIQNQEYTDKYTEEDSDISLTDEEYYKFEGTLLEILGGLKSELQRTLNYFVSNYGIKITNIVVVSNDIKGIDSRMIEYSGLKGSAVEIEKGEAFEVEEFSVINETSDLIDSQYAMLIGAVLSNHVRGNIYE